MQKCKNILGNKQEKELKHDVTNNAEKFMTKMSKYIDKCLDMYTIVGKDVKKFGVSEKCKVIKK